MALTAFESSATQITERSRDASAQIGQSAPSQKFMQTGQMWMLSLALSSASANARTSLSSISST